MLAYITRLSFATEVMVLVYSVEPISKTLCQVSASPERPPLPLIATILIDIQDEGVVIGCGAGRYRVGVVLTDRAPHKAVEQITPPP